MRTDWQGSYLDGRTAARQPATIRLMREGLEITTAAGGTRLWPYRELRQTQGSYAGEEVRLERGGELPETLLVADAAFLQSLHEASPHVGARFHDPRRRSARLRWTIVAAGGVLAATVALYLWGIPLLAALVTPRVPVAWEETLGRSAVAYLAPPARRCGDPALGAAMDAIVARLAGRGTAVTLHDAGLRGEPAGGERAGRAGRPRGDLPRPARAHGHARGAGGGVGPRAPAHPAAPHHARGHPGRGHRAPADGADRRRDGPARVRARGRPRARRSALLAAERGGGRRRGHEDAAGRPRGPRRPDRLLREDAEGGGRPAEGPHLSLLAPDARRAHRPPQGPGRHRATARPSPSCHAQTGPL